MIFGDWSIDFELFCWMKTNIPFNNTILEFGSGNSTSELIKYWNVISVEEDINWVNLYHDNYIYAPLVDNWYDFEILKNNIHNDIDAILVDGPAYGNREKFFTFFDFFLEKKPKIIVFDDTDREKDLNLFRQIVNHLNEINFQIEYDTSNNKKTFSFIKINYK